MSATVTISQPAGYVGLSDLLPSDAGALREFADELVRRLTVNHQAIAADIAAQALPSTGETSSDTYETTDAADARMALLLVAS